VVHQLELEDFAPGEYPEAVLRVLCGKGTYIRVLADDLARAMGGRAHLTELRRTAVGSLRVSSAAPLDTLGADIATRGLEANLLAPAEALGDLPWVTVDSATGYGVRHGARFARGVRPGEPCVGPFRVLDESGRLLAVYREEGRLAVPEVVLDEGAPG
jgi:tRNA pseudouridine55 synthase